MDDRTVAAAVAALLYCQTDTRHGPVRTSDTQYLYNLFHASTLDCIVVLPVFGRKVAVAAGSGG